MITRLDFKDLFSRQSNDYVRFRPRYPDTLFQYLSSLVNGHDLAWDCGTGNGQAAIQLAALFERVIATDPAPNQLSKATQHPRIEYRVGTAEKTEFAERSVDLITVAQAFHWFRQEEFFSESRRILKPGGVLAFWCYELCKISPEVDAVVFELYKGILGPYWEKQRQLVEEGYKNVRLPFQEISSPLLEMTSEWSFEHLIGYLGTWSALQTYLDKHHRNPLEIVYHQLKEAWGNAKIRPVRWELFLKVGRT